VDCDNEITESNETNNQWSSPIEVRMQGDINGDSQVNYLDMYILSRAYYSTPADSNWDARADLDYDGIVYYFDLFILSQNYPA
jgi:hypothetical protein